MPPRSSSGMESIRRELQRRRTKPLAPKSSVAKKPSVPPPPREGARCMGREPRPRRPAQEDSSSSTASKSGPGSASTHASRPTVVSPFTPPPSRSAPSSPGSVCPSTLSGADEHLRPGTEVGVRTRTTMLKTGEALVLWLRAMIVSRTDGGYEVIYAGNWPPGDPYGTVHVPRRHVRMIKPSLSQTTSPPSSATRSCPSDTTATGKKEMRATPPARPTTAGKSLRLIRSLLPG